MEKYLIDLLNPKIVSILRLFLDNSKDLFHLQKISRQSKVPLGTTFRLIKKLVSLDLVSVVTVEKLKLYKLNDDKKADFLRKVFE